MKDREQIAFVHGQHVRIGFDGPKGKIYRCQGRRGEYWKVKLEDGTWVWPHGVVADSDGPYQQRCAECNIPFRSPRPESLCPQCDPTAAILQDYQEHGVPIRNHAAYHATVAMNRAAGPVTRSAPVPEPTETPTHPKGCRCGETPTCTPF